MKKIMVVLVVTISLLISVGIVSAADRGINLFVTPITDSVLVGETATYTVTVKPITKVTEKVTLDVSNKIAGATYTFSDNGFDVGPYPDPVTVTMSIDIPSTAVAGNYPQTVTADAEWMGIPAYETSDFTTYVDVQIPEFSTIAIPVAAVFGLLLLMRRRKQQ